MRKIDYGFVGFFVVNLFFVTYVVDLEQLVIADPNAFTDPIWPPRFLVDVVHWWARSFDPLQWARPPWWRATIWLDVLFFGPFYAAAIFAFIKQREWIRIPAFVWAGMMISNVSIIMFEEAIGPHATPRLGVVTFANAAWFLFPFFVIWRLRNEHPFRA